MADASFFCAEKWQLPRNLFIHDVNMAKESGFSVAQVEGPTQFN